MFSYSTFSITKKAAKNQLKEDAKMQVLEGNVAIDLKRREVDVSSHVIIPGTIGKLMEVVDQYNSYVFPPIKVLPSGYDPRTPIFCEDEGEQLVFSAADGTVVGTLPRFF